MADPNCPICNGTGLKIIERGGLSGAETCGCRRSMRTEEVLETANIPSNYWGATLASFNWGASPMEQGGLAQVKTVVEGYVRNFPVVPQPGLMFVGDTGSGKTHLAIAVLKLLITEKHFDGLFFDYQNLLDRIRSGYDANSGASDREAYRSALDASVLLIDDLGAHRVTDWVEDTVTSIITHRCNHKKFTIVTTNLRDPASTEKKEKHKTPSGVVIYEKTLADMIGVRARSRLFEMCKVIQMPAIQDYRVKDQR